jgi:hypothetical protein
LLTVVTFSGFAFYRWPEFDFDEKVSLLMGRTALVSDVLGSYNALLRGGQMLQAPDEAMPASP